VVETKQAGQLIPDSSQAGASARLE
jgi:hypothetical protein